MVTKNEVKHLYAYTICVRPFLFFYCKSYFFQNDLFVQHFMHLFIKIIQHRVFFFFKV
jgi:hypothetical protein